MLYWKVFTLACSEISPFGKLDLPKGYLTQPEEFELKWQDRSGQLDADSKLCPFVVALGTENEVRGGNGIRLLFAVSTDTPAHLPVLELERTETDPTFWTLPHIVKSEDDVLHLRQLPDFDGHLRPSRVELLLQYLTVPYLRIPYPDLGFKPRTS